MGVCGRAGHGMGDGELSSVAIIPSATKDA